MGKIFLAIFWTLNCVHDNLLKKKILKKNLLLFCIWKHVLTLPAFGFFYKDLLGQIYLFNASERSIDLLVISIPLIWFFLICNTLTQYVCISSVFVLTTECTSLTVNLVITLRKFTSLILSIVYFQNPFTFWHWIGTALVFIGTFMFSNVTSGFISSIFTRQTVKTPPTPKKDE